MAISQLIVNRYSQVKRLQYFLCRIYKEQNEEAFTPEQQAMIDENCKSLKNKYSSLSVEDRNWYLANC